MKSMSKPASTLKSTTSTCGESALTAISHPGLLPYCPAGLEPPGVGAVVGALVGPAPSNKGLGMLAAVSVKYVAVKSVTVHQAISLQVDLLRNARDLVQGNTNIEDLVLKKNRLTWWLY